MSMIGTFVKPIKQTLSSFAVNMSVPFVFVLQVQVLKISSLLLLCKCHVVNFEFTWWV